VTAARSADVERLRVAAELERLRARRGRALALLDEQRELRQALASAVDDAVLGEVVGLDARLAAARASLLRDGARLTIEALTELDLVVDGEPRRAVRGEQLEPGANGRLELLLPELLRLRFDAGEGAEPLRREVETLERE